MAVCLSSYLLVFLCCLPVSVAVGVLRLADLLNGREAVLHGDSHLLEGKGSSPHVPMTRVVGRELRGIVH